ncbi:MAG TPA: (Fe-S)-binding protein [Candidatus Avipropionibacterium avicola]|uniref:(Fe-S)-binding protein n=1 Tax=Candidatus Avipropionibacterium avicola TaxID=2840701 RepID=A0A9D1KM14_9ACTN|nr:(Fe-S)-binding protein [Candidatus Avipropionibacterium avicola]
MRVSLFITCLADALFPQVGRATVSVLERLGCEVDFPSAQTCCGQMHMNSGYPDEAAGLVRGFAETFADAEAVVMPSGSCAAMLRHHHHTVAPGSAMPPLYELSEFLVDVLGVTDVGARFEHTVTYHPTCHSSRLLGVGDRPTRLLQAVSGLELLTLPAADQCCGFGGTFAIKNADTSSAMGVDKVGHARESGASYLCASDASCLMHIKGVIDHQDRARRRRTRVGQLQTIHLAEILASR